jgi:hypothetical protein
MFDQILLTAVQSRILLVLLLEGGLGTASLLNAVGISGKAWSRERERLASLGLLTSKERKSFSKMGVKVIMYHHLTQKGTGIANGIREISNSINTAVG